MCETCESFQGEKAGHHTFMSCAPGSAMSDGTCLWFCSRECVAMSPVPTIDDWRLEEMT